MVFGGSCQAPQFKEAEALRFEVCMNRPHMQKGLQYWYLSGSAEASFAVVILPGNPGLGSLYTPFARELQNALQKSVDVYPVYIVSYYGFEEPRNHRARPSSLNINEEPDRIRTFLDFVYAKEAKPLIVVAHGVGSWVAVKAIGSPNEFYNPGERYPIAHHVHQIVLCMPFLEVNHESHTVDWIKQLVKYQVVREFLTLIFHIAIHILPSFFMRTLVYLGAYGWRVKLILRRQGCADVVNSILDTFGSSAHYLAATMSLAQSAMLTLEPHTADSILHTKPRSPPLSAPSLALLSSVTSNYGSALDPLRIRRKLHANNVEQIRTIPYFGRRRSESDIPDADSAASCSANALSSSTDVTGRESNATFFDTYASKLVLIYAQDDRWAPLSDASTILHRKRSGIGFHVFDDLQPLVQHTFLLDVQQTKHLAETICQYVKADHPDRPR